MALNAAFSGIVQRSTQKFRKLRNNVLSRRAISILGCAGYCELLAKCIVKAPAIWRSGDLRPLDKAMAAATNTFRYRGKNIRFDCTYCDEAIQDGTFTFGLIREIAIRDCYLRHFPARKIESLSTVVDLGANRGVFSVFAGADARRVLSVEAQREFRAVIEHNALLNGFRHVEVAICAVGSSASLDLPSTGVPLVALGELLDRHGFSEVDLIKIDIEGSEFALFKRADWLQRVSCVCIEVHHDCGDPNEIVGCLERNHFSVTLADGDLQRVGPGREYKFVYAWR